MDGFTETEIDLAGLDGYGLTLDSSFAIAFDSGAGFESFISDFSDFLSGNSGAFGFDSLNDFFDNPDGMPELGPGGIPLSPPNPFSSSVPGSPEWFIQFFSLGAGGSEGDGAGNGVSGGDGTLDEIFVYGILNDGTGLSVWTYDVGGSLPAESYCDLMNGMQNGGAVVAGAGGAVFLGSLAGIVTAPEGATFGAVLGAVGGIGSALGTLGSGLNFVVTGRGC